jgi:DNA-binding protein H-NS
MAKSKESQLAQIEKQIKALEAKKKVMLSKKNEKALNQIVAIAKKNEISAADIANALNVRSRPRKSPGKHAIRKVVAPKYRNPDNHQQTWSGRGRTPLWVKALDDAGKLESAKV